MMDIFLQSFYRHSLSKRSVHYHQNYYNNITIKYYNFVTKIFFFFFIDLPKPNNNKNVATIFIKIYQQRSRTKCVKIGNIEYCLKRIFRRRRRFRIRRRT